MSAGDYFLQLLSKVDRTNTDALYLCVEIGSKAGRTSKTLLSNENVYLIMVDIWQPTAEYGRWTLAEYQEFKREAIEVTDFAKHRREIIQAPSMTAIDDVEYRSLDAVFLDANHDYQNTVADICEWYLKLRVGGIFAGRFYGEIEGTTEAVDYCQGRIGFELHTDKAGHGWYFKKE